MKRFSILLSLLMVLSANAASKKDYLFRVDVGSDAELAKSYCKEIHQYLTMEEKRKISGDCVFSDNESVKEDDYLKVVDVKKEGDKHRIDAKIVHSASLAQGLSFSWETNESVGSVKRLLSKFSEFSDEENLILSEVAAEDKYRESYPKANQKKKKHYVRSILEVGGMLLLGGGIYQLLDFSHDSDFAYSWEGLKGKFSERGFRFDDNHRMWNFYAHPLAGSVFYQMARSNGLNAAEGFLMAFVASALWEFIGEFPEVSSVNDQFQTAFAGPAIGEAAFQLGEFFRRGGDTVMNKILRNVFGAQQSIMNKLDGIKANKSDNLDEYGMDNNYWHRINIYSKVNKHFTDNGYNGISANVGFDMKVNTVEGIMKPGERHQVQFDTLFVEMAAELGLQGNLKHEFLFYAKSVWMGLISKKIKLDEKGKKKGYSLIFGPSSAYRLYEGMLGEKFDKFALVNLLGTTLDLQVYLGDVKIRVSADIFGNFTSIRSLAIEDFKNDYPSTIIKDNLTANKYSNGFGFSQTGDFEVEYKNFGTRMSWEYHKAFSIDGMNRNQDEINQSLDVTEIRARGDVELYYNVPKLGLHLGIGYDINYGNSRIHNIEGEPGKEYSNTQIGHTGYMTVGFEW